MTKYRSLESLLQQLSVPLTSGQLALADGWRNDEQALGLYKPDEPGLAAYVFSHGQEPGRYGVHFDYPVLPMNATALSVEDISLKALCDLLVMHFDLNEINI